VGLEVADLPKIFSISAELVGVCHPLKLELTVLGFAGATLFSVINIFVLSSSGSVERRAIMAFNSLFVNGALFLRGGVESILIIWK
jgi:hypothetical protein